MEADGAVDAQNAPTAPWKTLCVFHELPQGLSHQVTHEKLRKAPKYRWETRIDPKILIRRAEWRFGLELPDPEATLQPREVERLTDFLVAKVVRGPMDRATCIDSWEEDVAV